MLVVLLTTLTVGCSAYVSANSASNGHPSITAEPAGATVTTGQTATFTVAATGRGPLNYQWQKNGAAISGATASSYVTPATTSSDNGAQFTVVVSNGTGSITSNAATLTPTRIAASTPTTTVGGTATTAGDLDMTSRYDLRGASCTVGGVLRGRAQGNVYNMADPMEAEDPFIKPIIGEFFWFRIVN